MPPKTRTFLPRRWPAVLMALLAGAALVVAAVFLLAPFFIDIEEFPRSKVAALQIAELEKTLSMFKLDVGRYPTHAEGLQALVVKPADADGWDGPYLKEMPPDPWGNPYHYRNPGPGADIEIFSLGADNAPGGEGENADIRSVVKDDESSR